MALKFWMGLGSIYAVMAAAPLVEHLVDGPLPSAPLQAAAKAATQPVAQPKRPAPPAPASLQSQIDEIAAAYREPVGIAISDVSAGWTAAHLGDMPCPQQSVSKLWVAISVLDAVDHGRLRLNTPVLMTRADLSVFFQPIARKVGPLGYMTTVEELLQRAISDSDNAANDMLIRLMGGPEKVTAAIVRKQISGVRVGYEERVLQAKTAGLEWHNEWAGNMGFREARAALPGPVRDAAMAAYLADPPDAATADGMTDGLRRLKRGELLSPRSTQILLDIMATTRNGPRRLKGGLPEGWSISHKTGTGQDLRNYSVGINDVGVITAPDGHAYAVAVFIPKTVKGVGARLIFMQKVSEALVEHWSHEKGVAVVKAQGGGTEADEVTDPTPDTAIRRHRRT